MSRTNVLKILTLLGFGGVIYSLFWLIWVIFPITLVEARYQYKKTLETVFHTQTLSGVFIPNLRVATDTTYGTHKSAGLVIPAIYLDEPIVYNVDPNDEKSYRAALKQGIAHASGSSLPDTPGLGYYFAHSSTVDFVRQYNAVFYLLGKLKKDDDIYIWKDKRDVLYKVTESKITEASDVSFLTELTSGENVVLQTCWPPGTNQKRLLVFAKRVTTH